MSVGATHTPVAGDGPSTAVEIQGIVDEMAAALELHVPVSVSIVSANPLLVSVDPPKAGRTVFEMSFEDGFLDRLDEDELRAAIAHELGHVWIFTHHPYLQTEAGANAVAMRVVTRDSLERVYTKVWARRGVKGNLARFLGR